MRRYQLTPWHAWVAVATLLMFVVVTASMTRRAASSGAGPKDEQTAVRLTGDKAPVVFDKDFFRVIKPTESLYDRIIGSCQVIKRCEMITINFVVRSKGGAFLRRCEVIGHDVPIGRWDFSESISQEGDVDVKFESIEWFDKRR